MKASRTVSTSKRFRAGTRRTKRYRDVRYRKACFVVPCPPWTSITLARAA